MRGAGTARDRSERGQSLVEFGLIAFVFVMTLLGVVEMGRMVLVYTTIANAAKAGARYAIVHGGERTGSGASGPSGPTCPCAEIDTVVQHFASAGLIDTSGLGITVAYPDGSNNAGSAVSVTVTYPYSPLVSYFGSMLSVTLGSTSEGVVTF